MVRTQNDGEIPYSHHTMDHYRGSLETQIIPAYIYMLNLSPTEEQVYTLVYTFQALYGEACSFTDEYLRSRTNLSDAEAHDALASLLEFGLIEQVGTHITRFQDYPVYAISNAHAEAAQVKLESYRGNWEGLAGALDETCIFIQLDRKEV